MAPRGDKENIAGADNVSATPQLRKGKTIEQIYQKKTQLEHILLRPDTYVGSIEHQFQDMFVFDDKKGEIVHRKIDYVPALYKIFDEILVNAADNSMRDPKGMDLIDVTIDKEAGCISVMNNGNGIPVVMHKEHNCYVPELIFGHLLTSDNYDDNEKKVTGGRNGYGAKLTNVFSTKFQIETADHKTKKKFTQTYHNNMSQKDKPKIVDYTGKDYTRITFWPDFAKFGMTKLDDDIAGLMMKRAYDIAGSTPKKVRVVLNGKQLPVSNFEEYVGFYLKSSSAGEGESGPAPCIYERCSDRWEVAVSFTDGSFNQVSFVNSINTIKGGTHVVHVTEQLVETILKVVKGKNRGGIEIKPQHVKNHLWVFVNSLIENPAFDSQTKETLTTKQTKFGSTCELSEKLLKQVMKSGIVDLILDWAKAKQKVDMGRQLKGGTKNQTRILGVPKLEDANDAGGKNSHECTLILTEGDSAKSLAVAGLSIVGRDRYGVFPLKGKVLNVRDANFKQVTGNNEIQNLLKIMGLDIKREYDSSRGLRYGSIMLMTDQDHDGSHIKGLLINLVQHWWPSLVQMNGFLKEFVTPIVKVWKEGKKDSERKDERCFFTMAEYHKFKNRTQGGKGWKTKYYKGLGTSTAKEAKEYFRDIENHEIKFRWQDEEDSEAVDLAFNKKRADDRKEWINSYEEGSHVDHTQSHISYYDFVHKELVQFAKYDVQRSVPSIVDGFKPSQRKVVFCAFKKKLKNDIKVAQFVGYISEQSAYHHGETSLENTIINLAQNYVGSNNVNLLFPSGQFGTRLQGGKDHAASRYIYTRLCQATRLIFHPDDDAVLNYLDEEGQKIEPKWYCPILPTVLVNGADGIGTGWSTSVPNYNPRDIIRNIQKKLRGEPMEEMCPWYKGYKGSIVMSEKEVGKYDVVGCIEKKDDTTLVITELPIKTWTQSYKEFLEELMPQDGKKADDSGSEHIISDYREYHTENSVHFELTLTPEKMQQVEQAGLEKTFKLRSTIATSNMILFDEEGKIGKYNTAVDILQEFCKLRKRVYDQRKAYMVAKLTRETEILSNKARFILMVVKGELELRKRKKADLLKELQKKGFKPMSELDAILEGKVDDKHKGADDDANNAAAEDATQEDAEKSDYDYLLGMNLWSLTFEKVEEIKKQHETKVDELNTLKKTTIETMWDRDLQALSKALDEIDAAEAEEAEAAAAAADGRRTKDATRQAGAKRRAAPKARVANKHADDDYAREEKALLKRPLQAVASEGEVQKTTWGSSAPPTRKVAEPDMPRSMDDATPSSSSTVPARPISRGPKRQRAAQGEDAKEAGSEQAPAPAPAKEESGASLLSRLLSRSGPDMPMEQPLQSFSSFSALGGTDDLFSYLRGSDQSKQYNALDFGDPPLASHDTEVSSGAGVSVDPLQTDTLTCEEPTSKTGKGRGRGRGRGRGGAKMKADGGDMPATKRQKSEVPEATE